MSMVDQASKWVEIHATVRGASHVRAGMPNQDSVRVCTLNGNLPAVLAVSDGHGSAKCFRSQDGSRIAVEVAINELMGFAESIPTLEVEPSAVHQAVKEGLPKSIVRHWRDAVQKHYSEFPFLDDELNRLDESTKVNIEEARQQNDPYIVYGATLVAVLLTEKYFICLQLGDGDVLAISNRTGQAEHPLETDQGLIANETTSLCQENAWTKFRYRCQRLLGSPPPLILLATDGYSNSFATPEGFRQVAEDLHNLLARDGVEKIRESLPSWLEEASQNGSGDDVTAAILYCESQGLIEETTAHASQNQTVISNSSADSAVTEKKTPFLTKCILSLRYGYLTLRRWFRRNPDVGMVSAILFVVLVVLVAFGILPR